MGPVGASLFPHCLPASRLLPRVTSVHLPDYAHYYTIGPGMFPSSQIPSWKVCVSPSSPPSLIASVLTPLLPLQFSPRFSPHPLPLTLCLLPHNTSSLSKFSLGENQNPTGSSETEMSTRSWAGGVAFRRHQLTLLDPSRPRWSMLGILGSKVYVLVLPSWGIPEGIAGIEDCVPQTVPLSPLSGHGDRTMPPDRCWLFFFNL